MHKTAWDVVVGNFDLLTLAAYNLTTVPPRPNLRSLYNQW